MVGRRSYPGNLVILSTIPELLEIYARAELSVNEYRTQHLWIQRLHR